MSGGAWRCLHKCFGLLVVLTRTIYLAFFVLLACCIRDVGGLGFRVLGFRVSHRRCLWVFLSGGLLIDFNGPPHPLTHKHRTASVLPAPTTQT